jgi:hypothetical protein
MSKIQKFEAFQPEEVDNDLYLHGEVNEPRREKADNIDPLRLKLKSLSWTELTVGDFNPFFITYDLPKELEAEVKSSYKVNDPILEIIINGDDDNRTHSGIDPKLKGLGLVYKSYKATVQQIGYITSRKKDSTPDAKNIWKGLIQDPAFYAALTQDRVLVMSKELSDTKIHELVGKFTANQRRWKADTELLSRLKGN